MGARWRIQVGDEQRTLAAVFRDTDLAPVDLSAAQSVTATITRLGDLTEVQQNLVTPTDAAAGEVDIVTDAAVASLPGHCLVTLTAVWASGEVRSWSDHLLVTGPRPTTPATQPPLDLGDDFVITVAQWTPAGDLVTEVQRIGPDLVPIGTPTYLWDDPGDATNALVPWPGDPNTLLDNQP